VLRFERQASEVLTDAIDPARRATVARWVDESLRDMPRHLRVGVAAVSLVLGAWAGAARRDPAAVVAAIGHGPVPALRHYRRLLRSLVVFAALESQ
jgi:hypothetical protein